MASPYPSSDDLSPQASATWARTAWARGDKGQRIEGPARAGGADTPTAPHLGYYRNAEPIALVAPERKAGAHRARQGAASMADAGAAPAVDPSAMLSAGRTLELRAAVAAEYD